MSEDARRMVSPQECADLLSVNKETVLDWIKAGKLPASRLSSRIIRIRVVDIDALAKRMAA